MTLPSFHPCKLKQIYMENVAFNTDYLEKIAYVCHAVNKAWCEANGDTSQKPWEEAEQWQRESAVNGVAFRINNPEAPASTQHEAWMADKVANGWVYGEVKDAVAKTHPCMVPYNELPIVDRLKDKLFQSVVDTLK
jgi:hypothetical protein